MGDYKNILIVNLGGIGDLLLSTPALRSLKDKYPHSRICLLVVRRVVELAEDLTYIDEIVVFRLKGVTSLLANIVTLWNLRKRHFDLAVNMRTMVSALSALKMRFLLSFLNPTSKAGRNTEGRGSFFDASIPEPYRGQMHEMEYDITLVEKIGAVVGSRKIDFVIKGASVDKVNALLRKHGISENDFVVAVHPGGMPSRRWGVAHFAQLIAEIDKKRKAVFVITGSKEEGRLTQAIIRGCPQARVLSMAGKLGINELGALLKRCSLFITNDTGPMHIAAVLGIPMCALFGGGDIVRFDPRVISSRAEVLRVQKACAPCEKFYCPHAQCLQEISVGMVLEAVLRLLPF
ncbi:MAG: glycosyltransferase family 9 protein [Candidatus Omnitrophota bacterium]|nr:MAG: glycosyltransferase family 9 protein [Candidatus Omnitrophota bacterium]